MGKTRLFPTPESMIKKTKEYMKVCKKEGKPFLLIGFASWMEIHKSTLSDYKRFPEYSGALALINQTAETQLVEGALMGKYNASFSQFLAKNNHGYTDQQHLEVSGKLDLATMAKDRYDKIKNEK